MLFRQAVAKPGHTSPEITEKTLCLADTPLKTRMNSRSSGHSSWRPWTPRS